MVEGFRVTRSENQKSIKGKIMARANPSAISEPTLSGVRVNPAPGGLGAEIEGLDLADIGRGARLNFLKTAYLKHHVVYLRQQTFTKDQMLALALEFGPVERHLNFRVDGANIPAIHEVTNLDANGKPSDNPLNNENYYWHPDKAYLPHPALLTILHGIEVPPSGGDTQFADMTRAYEALSAPMKEKIGDLKVVHSWRHMRATVSNRKLTDEEVRTFPDVVHPMVRVHPETGAKSLLIGMYAASVVGMSDVEGRRLLDELLDHSTQLQFLYSHKWQKNDVIMWDNRCLMHRALPNFDRSAHRRILRRVVVQDSAR